MIDIHHHLLPGLDDGAKDLETSVAMARMAAQDGITHVVCSPHSSNHYRYDPVIVSKKLQELRQEIKAEDIPLELGVACDFHLNYENIEDAIANPQRYSINGKTYLLVELPDLGIPPNLEETFYRLRLAGMTPILTHPERNPTLQNDAGRLKDWMQAGMLVQVTTSSVLGQMGKTAQKMSHKLLEDRWVHFLATDAHNLRSRPPKMREACDMVSQKYGAEYARLLCFSNPKAAYDGEPLGLQETPRNLYDEENGEKGFWKRLFGK
jgi:protein-tyrosine phosphatase